jgi:DNA repair protein RecO (recombination protein O)
MRGALGCTTSTELEVKAAGVPPPPATAILHAGADRLGGGKSPVRGPPDFRWSRHGAARATGFRVRDNGDVGLYRDEAVVLRTQKLGEADRIVALLTRRHGRVRAVAKGVRRTSSRFGSRLEPFMHVDVQLAEGRSLDVVTQAETLDPFGESICSDYVLYTTGTAMLETAERLVGEEHEPALQQYLLLVGALRTLSRRNREPGLVLDSFLLRSLAVAGYAPSFSDCARCGAPGPHRSFSPAAGGSLCGHCRVPGTASPAEETVVLLAALLAGDWPTAEASEARHRREADGLVAAFLQWHLERGLRSLPYVDRSPARPRGG